MNKISICFDLDGTLVNSEESILFCLEKILKQNNFESKVPLNNNLIGPPLNDLLKLVSGSSDIDILSSLAADFNEVYDNDAFKSALPYDGITELLIFLKSSKSNVKIATNKRISATNKIIEHLKWNHYFHKVVALDSPNPPFQNKSKMLSYILKNNNGKKLVYIGDTINDFIAAKENKINFIGVGWGYGDKEFKNSNEFFVAESPIQLINYFISNYDGNN